MKKFKYFIFGLLPLAGALALSIIACLFSRLKRVIGVT